MTDGPTHLVPERTCQRCGAVIPAIQEYCLVCLAGDLKLVADQYLDLSSSFGDRLEGSDFTIEEEIGRGGMGIVYRGRQKSPARDVAIKVLLPHHASSPDIRRRLLAEAAAMAELNHPGILPLYASGEHDGQPWLAMKLARGGTLSTRRSEWTGRWRATAELLADLADAVQHAHERGLIHRDVKPGNVLFDENSRACLADFGLVKWINADASDTLSFALLGTPAYLAPEVAQAGARNATTASDIYGLGAILYEMLTGAPPFKGAATAELLRRIATEEPPAPRRLQPNIPGDLEIICQKAIAKEPAARYSSAAALASDLRRWLEGKVIRARRFSAGEKLVRWARRNPLPASLAAALAIAVVAGGITVGVQNQSLRVTAARLDHSLTKEKSARKAADGNIRFMVRELPMQLEPLGKLDLLNGVFEYLQQYYQEFGNPDNPGSLSQQAEFNTQWFSVLSGQGRGAEARKKLNTAVTLGAAAISLEGAGVDEWVAYLAALHWRGYDAAREADFDAAKSDLQSAINSAEEALKRFPGNLTLLADKVTAVSEMGSMMRNREYGEDVKLAIDTLKKSQQMVRELQGQIEAAGRPRDLYLRSLRLEGYCCFELGRASGAKGAHREALAYFRRNLEVCEQLVRELPESGTEGRELCAGCIRLFYALFTANGDEALQEAAQFAIRAEEIMRPLADHDKANLFWQSEWGRSALAMAFLEDRRKNAAKSREWLEESLRRLKPVNRAASATVIRSRAAALSYLAENWGKAGDVTAACNYWDQAIATGFENLLACPSWQTAHSDWQRYIDKATSYQNKKAPERIEGCLTPWVGKVEAEMSRPGASSLWKASAAFLHRRLADRFRAARDMPGAAGANRKAFNLTSELLMSETGNDSISTVTNAAWNLLRSEPGAEDRKELARRLLRCAGPAAMREPDGKWRADWGKFIYHALRCLDSADAEPLAREACLAFFPEGTTRVRTPGEQNAYDLLRTIQDM